MLCNSFSRIGTVRVALPKRNTRSSESSCYRSPVRKRAVTCSATLYSTKKIRAGMKKGYSFSRGEGGGVLIIAASLLPFLSTPAISAELTVDKKIEESS